MLGQPAYERDLMAAPLYHDGTHRQPWARLDALARWSWERKAAPPRYDGSHLPRCGLYWTAKGQAAHAAAIAAMIQATEAAQ